MGLFSFFKKNNAAEQNLEKEELNAAAEVENQSDNEANERETESVKSDAALQEEIKTVESDSKEIEEYPAEEEKSEPSGQNFQASEENNVTESSEEQSDKKDLDESDSAQAEESSLKAEEVSSDNTDSEKETPEKVKLSFFERLKRTRENLAYGISALVKGRKIDDDLYDDLETALLTADLGVETTNTVIERLKEESKLRDLHDAGALKVNLKNILKDILSPCAQPLEIKKNADTPYVILMVGVNGAGKTTTIGKLALKYKSQGMKVMLAAGDTFRAAAVEQLKEWGKRTDTPVIAQPTGSDSASVIFDALTAAKARNADVLICDTAGRLQNKDNLMEELKKIVRVMKKIDENVPNEVMLVLDATTGQNAVSQMKIFKEAVNVSGLCLTKLDGTAKGGVVFCLADKFRIPVRYIGIGEKSEDLRDFSIENFVDALID